MWTGVLIFLPMLLALAAVGFVIWLRREARKDDATQDPVHQASRVGGGGGPTKPVPPK